MRVFESELELIGQLQQSFSPTLYLSICLCLLLANSLPLDNSISRSLHRLVSPECSSIAFVDNNNHYINSCGMTNLSNSVE